jgi:hypothetical protein
MAKVTYRAQVDSIDFYKSQRLTQRNSRWSRAAKGFLWLSTIFALAVAYSTTVTLYSLQFVGVSSVETTRQITQGTALEALQWLIFTLSLLFSLGVQRIVQQAGPSSVAVGVSQPGYSAPGLGMAVPGSLPPGPPRPGPPPSGPPRPIYN